MDATVLAAYRTDRGFFARLHCENQALVRAYLVSRARGLDGHDLDDLVQEVFARAWRMRSRFRGGSTLQTYLVAIARNVLREFFVQRRRHAAGPICGAYADNRGMDLVKIVEQRDMLHRMRRMLASLSRHQRQALELVCIDGKSPIEAAALCGTTVKAMRRRIENARARLAVLLSDRDNSCDHRLKRRTADARPRVQSPTDSWR